MRFSTSPGASCAASNALAPIALATNRATRKKTNKSGKNRTKFTVENVVFLAHKQTPEVGRLLAAYGRKGLDWLQVPKPAAMPDFKDLLRQLGDGGSSEDTARAGGPVEGMPQLANPDRGWTTTANNRPAPDDFPYPLAGVWDSGHRAKRIRRLPSLRTSAPALRLVRKVPPVIPAAPTTAINSPSGSREGITGCIWTESRRASRQRRG